MSVSETVHEKLVAAFMASRAQRGDCIAGPDCSACSRASREAADTAMEAVRPFLVSDAPAIADTEAEFARKDREYFELVGKTAVVGNRLYRITEYTSAPGPQYFFELTSKDRGHLIKGATRESFWVLEEL